MKLKNDFYSKALVRSAKARAIWRRCRHIKLNFLFIVLHNKNSISIQVIKPKFICIPRGIRFKNILSNCASLYKLLEKRLNVFNVYPDYRTAKQWVVFCVGMPL